MRVAFILLAAGAVSSISASRASIKDMVRAKRIRKARELTEATQETALGYMYDAPAPEPHLHITPRPPPPPTPPPPPPPATTAGCAGLQRDFGGVGWAPGTGERAPVQRACDGTTTGSEPYCHFPFSYEGKTYTGCTSVDHDQPWCYTNAAKTEWGHCHCGHTTTCGGTAMEGAACSFPFTYRGVTHNACTSDGHDQKWCYTNAAKTQWGNCDCPGFDHGAHGHLATGWTMRTHGRQLHSAAVRVCPATSCYNDNICMLPTADVADIQFPRRRLGEEARRLSLLQTIGCWLNPGSTFCQTTLGGIAGPALKLKIAKHRASRSEAKRNYCARVKALKIDIDDLKAKYEAVSYRADAYLRCEFEKHGADGFKKGKFGHHSNGFEACSAPGTAEKYHDDVNELFLINVVKLPKLVKRHKRAQNMLVSDFKFNPTDCEDSWYNKAIDLTPWFIQNNYLGSISFFDDKCYFVEMALELASTAIDTWLQAHFGTIWSDNVCSEESMGLMDKMFNFVDEKVPGIGVVAKRLPQTPVKWLQKQAKKKGEKATGTDSTKDAEKKLINKAAAMVFDKVCEVAGSYIVDQNKTPLRTTDVQLPGPLPPTIAEMHDICKNKLNWAPDLLAAIVVDIGCMTPAAGIWDALKPYIMCGVKTSAVGEAIGCTNLNADECPSWDPNPLRNKDHWSARSFPAGHPSNPGTLPDPGELLQLREAP